MLASFEGQAFVSIVRPAQGDVQSSLVVRAGDSASVEHVGVEKASWTVDVL